MAISGTYVVDIPLKVSAEKYYKRWKKETQVFPEAVSHLVQGISVENGDWDSYDPVILWNYSCDGKQEVFKEKREFDDKNMVVTVRGIEGDVMKELKVYDVVFHLIPKSEETCVCKVTMIWEKRNEESQEPIKYLNYVKSLTVDMADHILKVNG